MHTRSTVPPPPIPKAPPLPPTPTTTSPIFFGLGLAPGLLDALSQLKIHTPTPIQERAIPLALDGKDVVGIAQTGTGKTLAFGLPMIQRLAQSKGQGLVLLPTRELAIQVEENLRRIGRAIGLRTAVLIGGAPMNPQIHALRAKPHVIIATPGRLVDHLEQKTLNLDRVHVLVLDEADRMLDMGFAPQLNKILLRVPKERQTMLFSATMPSEITKMAATHMRQPLRVEVAPQGTTAERVTQEIFIVRKEDKIRLLNHVLSEVRGSVIVFSRTRHGAKKITRDVRGMGHAAAEIHSDRSLAQRREALEGFRSGKYRVLIATDIAARGIDVKGIELVINFDLPDDAQDYVHRIGRTGRAGMEGRAMSFATPDQRGDIRIIERLTRKAIPQTNLPAELPPAPPRPAFEAPERPERSARPFRGGASSQGASRGRFRDRYATAPTSAPDTYGNYPRRRANSPRRSGR
ncbi:DEAD/DEAH box helicase [Patescibacteria group bacterium]|nr:DEAD/DEAH box helicase [Patescibacteria group bacterium]MBP9710014.1 DEAD/DEAH box helicase [Patescibacteria group bacterium]